MLLDATGRKVATLPASRHETLLDCLLRHGRPVRTVCLGSLICGRCWVVVEEGLDALPPPAPDEARLLARVAPGEPRARLACQIGLPPGRDRLVVSTAYWKP